MVRDRELVSDVDRNRALLDIIEDVRGAIDLLRHSAENLHTYNWKFK